MVYTDDWKGKSVRIVSNGLQIGGSTVTVVDEEGNDTGQKIPWLDSVSLTIGHVLDADEILVRAHLVAIAPQVDVTVAAESITYGEVSREELSERRAARESNE